MKTECFTCRLLRMTKVPEDKHRVTNKGYRCSAGRFDQSTRPDGSTIPQYFAWSGIAIPNKTVGKAQTNCPKYQLML